MSYFNTHSSWSIEIACIKLITYVSYTYNADQSKDSRRDSEKCFIHKLDPSLLLFIMMSEDLLELI